MKFARTDLIAKVEAEIARREQYAVTKTAEDAEKYATELAEYIERTTLAWGQLADTIRQRKRYGKPVTIADVPQALWGRYGRDAIQAWGKTPPTPREADTAALRALLGLLQTAVDEEISTAALERMGFSMSALLRSR